VVAELELLARGSRLWSSRSSRGTRGASLAYFQPGNQSYGGGGRHGEMEVRY
jgi:uncharacterized membrane protein YgcG